MKIAALLAFYDEQPEFLERTVESLPSIADYLVALDGRWATFPGIGAESPGHQIAAISSTLDRVGLAGVVLPPPGNEPWESQVAKRAQLFQAGRDLAGADWFFVIDADEIVAECDRDQLHALLGGHPDADVAEIVGLPLNPTWPRSQMHSHPQRWRRLYRNLPELTVQDDHSTHVVSDQYLAGRGRDLAPALDATKLVTIHHFNRARSKKREAAMAVHRRAEAAA